MFENGYARISLLFAYFLCAHLTNMLVLNMQSQPQDKQNRFISAKGISFDVVMLLPTPNAPQTF
jgi:hypothetical protein